MIDEQEEKKDLEIVTRFRTSKGNSDAHQRARRRRYGRG
jgi:hypothetical protein